MGLVSGRILLIIVAIVLALGFAIGSNNGTVVWGKPKYDCFGGRHWVAQGPKLTWLQAGRLALKYQPYEWTCDSDHTYDPNVYHVVDGTLAPNSPTPTN